MRKAPPKGGGGKVEEAPATYRGCGCPASSRNSWPLLSRTSATAALSLSADGLLALAELFCTPSVIGLQSEPTDWKAEIGSCLPPREVQARDEYCREGCMEVTCISQNKFMQTRHLHSSPSFYGQRPASLPNSSFSENMSFCHT